MKRLTISAAIAAVLAFPALAQFQPCIAVPPTVESFRLHTATQQIENTQTHERGTRYIFADGTYLDDFPSTRRPAEAVDAFSQTYKINLASWWQIPFYMPVAGRCVGSFDSYDDRSDAFKMVQDAAGRYVRVPVSGDIEILIVTDQEWARIRGAIGTLSYQAVYSSGRSYGGAFGVDLAPGWYHLVINNSFSNGAKSVNLKFGGKLPDVRP